MPVSEPQPSRYPHGKSGGTRPGAESPAAKRNLLERLLEFIHPGPDSTRELIETLEPLLRQLPPEDRPESLET